MAVPTKTTASSAGEAVVHDPASLKKKLETQWADEWRSRHQRPGGWLADEDWKALKRRVYRLESGLKYEGRDKPVFADHYFVEVSRTQNFFVFSYTERPDHVAYRTQAEDIIRSFQFGPADKSPAQQPTGQPTAIVPGASPAQADAPGAARPRWPRRRLGARLRDRRSDGDLRRMSATRSSNLLNAPLKSYSRYEPVLTP